MAFVMPHLRSGQRVLDVGCGPGSITLDVAERVAPGEVVGVDSVEGIIEQAQSLAAARGVNAQFKVDNTYSLSFADDSFDVVMAHQVLQHLADPVGALKEMRRVSRPGALIAARDADYVFACGSNSSHRAIQFAV